MEKKINNFDRTTELKAFDETKAGVKGLVDAGITKVPRIFISPPDGHKASKDDQHFNIPVFDLGGIENDAVRRKEIVDGVKDASGTWGFFQVVNHGIPTSVLDEMLEGVRRFYEMDTEIKKQWYTRDGSKTVVYNSNFDLFRAAAANWRDTSYCNMAPRTPDLDELPEPCRYHDGVLEAHSETVSIVIRDTVWSRGALGLNPNYLNEIGCCEGHAVLCHYYPACPEPELTLGATKHADYDFITVLLQDNIGGLQILYRDHWIDIPPVPGALVVNIGDLLQLISNDKFKSSQHRVLANHTGPRVSVACFITTGLMPSPKVYGPIKELLSEEDGPKYKETTVREYSLHYNAKGLGKSPALHDFRL